MPPTASDISALQAWINGGYTSGAACAPDAGTATVSAAVFASGAKFTASGSACNGKHNVGKDCLQCHGFAFAGTIYDGSGNALSGAEVRVVDSTGTAISTYSCSNGNFYVQNGSFTAPGHTAARNADGVGDDQRRLQLVPLHRCRLRHDAHPPALIQGRAGSAATGERRSGGRRMTMDEGRSGMHASPVSRGRRSRDGRGSMLWGWRDAGSGGSHLGGQRRSARRGNVAGGG
jgi:hypothetical protein